MDQLRDNKETSFVPTVLHLGGNRARDTFRRTRLHVYKPNHQSTEMLPYLHYVYVIFGMKAHGCVDKTKSKSHIIKYVVYSMSCENNILPETQSTKTG